MGKHPYKLFKQYFKQCCFHFFKSSSSLCTNSWTSTALLCGSMWSKRRSIGIWDGSFETYAISLQVPYR